VAASRPQEDAMTPDRPWIDRWIAAINADAGAANLGRQFDGAFTFAIGPNRYVFNVHRGRVESVVENGGPLVPSSFTLSADETTWRRLFEPNPPAMNHAIFAAVATGNMQLEGDIRPLFQHMTVFSRWLTLARMLNGKPEVAPDPEWHDEWQAVGRYVNVPLDGCRHKVFYFEAGEGIPILCQHSAGNESRQWRHLLEDRELTRRYRIIAYDLPAHGKSDPPNGRNFFEEDHLLTSDWVTRFVVGLADALRLDRPVFIGCSIGGVIALHLAERFPERFRGLISLAGAVPTYGFFHDWWIDPGVNTIMMEPALMDAVMAPGLSHWDRQMNRMIQGAHPRSLRNDLYFWGVENADPARAERIDATKVPIYMYAGEYDFTCPPEHIEASARRIGSAVHYEMLPGLGHFPMSENYALFRPTLMRTLDDIGKRTGGR
jgi:pimeloyl-ACP methyl ester carboxylesterase